MANRITELCRLLRNRYLPPDELRKLQESKLRAVIEHAYRNVPYYQTLFHSAGLAPQDVRTLEDLARVPITSKEALRAVGVEGALARGVDPSTCEVMRTSGSTGKPFASYHSHREATMQTMVGFRALLTAGVRPTDRLAGLRPRLQPPSLMTRLGLYRSYRVSRSLVPEEQVRLLRMVQPTVLRIAPSRLRAILHVVDYRISEIARPRMLITSGEVLDEGLKTRVLADLDVDFFNFYVSTEFAELASDCPAHEGLHVNADQLIIECVDDDGQPVEPGQPGTVAVTNLCGYTMPFIRYCLGDICTPIGDRCSCGSSFPLISAPLGRQDDVLRLPSGKILSTTGLGLIMMKLDEVDQYRFIQESPARIVLQLVLRKHLGEDRLAQVRNQVLDYLREPLSLDVEILPQLPEEKTKFRIFVSRVPTPLPTDSKDEVYSAMNTLGQ